MGEKIKYTLIISHWVCRLFAHTVAQYSAAEKHRGWFAKCLSRCAPPGSSSFAQDIISADYFGCDCFMGFLNDIVLSLVTPRYLSEVYPKYTFSWLFAMLLLRWIYDIIASKISSFDFLMTVTQKLKTNITNETRAMDCSVYNFLQ